MTRYLLDRAAAVTAIELDRELAARLREEWAHEPRFRLIEGDALDIDFTATGATTLAGNLPYYVATAIITKYLENPGPLRQGVFLIQKEVAQRITAKPGTRDFGYLAVECQSQAEAQYLFSVPPGAFRPPPKVDSAVIRLKPLPRRPDVTEFLEFASACFRQKRKTLRNNLAGRYPKETLNSLEVLSRRAEELSVEELEQLFRTIGPRRLS